MCKLAIVMIWLPLIMEAGQSNKGGDTTCDEILSKNLIQISQSEAMKRVIHCEPPIIPDLLRRANFKGNVVLEIVVDPTGKVICIKALSGHSLFKGSAIDAVNKWSFQPMLQDGVPVGFKTLLIFLFSTSPEAPVKGKECLQAVWNK
jgi:TonB family protein